MERARVLASLIMEIGPASCLNVLRLRRDSRRPRAFWVDAAKCA
jgi:hypothetical protein